LRLREGKYFSSCGRRMWVVVRAAMGPVLGELVDAGCLEWFESSAGQPPRLRVAEPSILVTTELLVRIEGALEAWRDAGGVLAGEGRSVVADAQPAAEVADRAVLAGR
jgi:hypothetical protein